MIKLNGQVITPTIFPDRTSQVWKLPDALLREHRYDVEWEFESEGEFIHLAQLRELLRTQYKECNLAIRYLPYARQDKEVANDKTFALRTFARLLNSLMFDNILCTDPHSDIAETLIENFTPMYPINTIKLILEKYGFDLVCFPDKGALKKYSNLFKHDFIYGEKIRDQLTGQITSYELIGDPKDKSILIVDDICDGGATFTTLAKGLLELGSKEVGLYVSHGIFSRGTQVLFDSAIRHIFTKERKIA